MDTKARSRFTELLVAIAVVGIALIWAERNVWNQITALRKETNANQIERILKFDRPAAERFLATANTALLRLERFLFVSLLGLLVSAAVLVVFAYRRMIAPLRTTLTESRGIIERQEKLASLGVFAAGIAHEIRNPLTAIKVRLFSLKQIHRSGTSEHEDLQVIGAEIDRLEQIVKEFLLFARPADPQLRAVPVGKLLQDISELLRADLAKKGIQIKLEISVNQPVRVDPNKFKQVLLNLVQNAAESISGNGVVKLRSRLDRRMLRGKMQPVVAIDVVDNGTGMAPEIQKRLFDPFFTTKEHGTGLGLPIAARIIEKHGGAMEYQTAAGQGTTFSIVLPKLPTDDGQQGTSD
jgi:signal transduction histidine kinase